MVSEQTTYLGPNGKNAVSIGDQWDQLVVSSRSPYFRRVPVCPAQVQGVKLSQETSKTLTEATQYDRYAFRKAPQ